MTAPTHSLEIEIKFDVDADTPLPDWSDLPGVRTVGAPELRPLDAVYLDTVDLVLARAAVALRRRTGGPDAGWHVKTTVPEGRNEYHWPLDDGSGEPDEVRVPTEVAASVSAWVLDAEAIIPIARMRSRRIAYAMTNADGALVAEFTDDVVDAADLLRGTAATWREWEFELGPAGPAHAEGRAELFAAVGAAVAAVGGRPAAAGSKLQRVIAG